MSYPTGTLSSQSLEIGYHLSAGPRLVHLSYKGSPNLLAVLPEKTVPTIYGDYHFLGGHRLWHAPEALPRSYIPDDDGLTIDRLTDGVLLSGKTEPGTGIRKSIEIRLDPDRAAVHLTHTLTNEGLWEVELAPWAITMFRLGGVVIIPILEPGSDTLGLLPNRHFSLWPYSRIHDPRLRMEDEAILLSAEPGPTPFKIGAFTPLGWIAYWLDGILFRKTFEVYPERLCPDFDCNVETYCGNEFVELESIGPLTRLPPEAQVRHLETWEFYEGLEQSFIPKGLNL